MCVVQMADNMCGTDNMCGAYSVVMCVVQMADNMSADEVLKVIKRELALVSQKVRHAVPVLEWTQVIAR